VRRLPFSLVFFLATAAIAALQAFPPTGIVLMFMLAMFWSVLLVNAGMIGTAFEAMSGRVSRLWLLLPVAFYGAYYAFAVSDHRALASLTARYDAANARVSVPFDSAGQALVFDNDGNDAGWRVQNYGLPVAYTRNANYPEGYRSSRMMANEICHEVGADPALRAAGIYSFGFHDGEAINSRVMERGFCDLGMPERPALPPVTIALQTDKVREWTLPVTRVTRTVTMPDGQPYQLLGGVAAPLSWIPMPIIGCFLNSGAPSWDCDAGFQRDSGTPIVSGDTRSSRDSVVLARALGLQKVEIAARQGADPSVVRARMAEVEAATLARQLAAIDRMVADPTAKVDDWQTGVVVGRPEALAAKADAIMLGLERAAAVGGKDRWRARESGRILAQLVAKLSPKQFVTFGPRLLQLYRTNLEPVTFDGRRSPESHWLWGSDPLLARIGDLGPAALFVAVDPRASMPNVNGAGIEAMCRIGAPGRDQSGPVLLEKWRALEANDRDRRRALFVALRRVGVTPPPIVETDEERTRRERGNRMFGGVFQQRVSPMEELIRDWNDVSPASPARVCSPAEWQARQEEKYGGKRRSNTA
jgi:hypothetical protein